MTIVRDPAPDATFALLRDGYEFVSNRAKRFGTDAFETRLTLRPVVCTVGREAAEMFYHSGRFTRQGAMPVTALTLLQDRGSVQALDGEDHRVRKATWMRMAASDEAVEDLSTRFRVCLRDRMAKWSEAPTVLHSQARSALAEAACGWAGVTSDEASLRKRVAELGAMIDGAGSIGFAQVKGQVLRQRGERWARRVMASALKDPTSVPPGSPVRMLAEHRDADGKRLDVPSAAVELLNVLRPVVAVARYVVFAALALHQHPQWRGRLKDDAALVRPFVQEVRRLSPFFPLIGGRVLEPFSWRGRRFDEGDWVVLDIYGTNRDPLVWEEPEVFNPERFISREPNAYAMAPQGAGSYQAGHRCPGERATVALIEEAASALVRVEYEVPPQDLSISLTKMPTLPKSGFVVLGSKTASHAVS
ncbi:cytochrome P450 [Parvularcula oceani]|uniref:cytochrome P450 n=1 Tax=Parvularcula oceani TaxID=1247963 RepID=UPI0004E25118|nr:cytochrome P450 [Parvularcula oceani]